MRVVHKYPIDVRNRVYSIDVRMTAMAKVVAVQVQHAVPCVWIELDPEIPEEKRFRTERFELVGTGQEIKNDNARHVGTVQLADGELVLHVYQTCIRV